MNIGARCLKARVEGERHTAHEKREFDEMIATKNESALDPMAFSMVSTGVLVDWSPASCLMYTKVCFRVVLSPHTLPRAEQSSFPNLRL